MLCVIDRDVLAQNLHVKTRSMALEQCCSIATTKVITVEEEVSHFESVCLTIFSSSSAAFNFSSALASWIFVSSL
jgi:hypothetical protein